jgi:four helix bundle protein
MREILPLLPPEEQDDLRDQLSRSAKAAPRLVAEGYAKRHQRRGFQKYLDDALAECNECIVSLEQVRDLYSGRPEKFSALLDDYDKCARQLYKLTIAWSNFSSPNRSSMPSNETSIDTPTV